MNVLRLDELTQHHHDTATYLRELRTHPHGPTPNAGTTQEAGKACVSLCGGDADRGRTLWKIVVKDCGGYMPKAAAIALIRASMTTNLIPDVQAPEPS